MRLLLAEDERALSNALSAILKHNNYSVDAVYDGLSAIEYIETGLYDAAIFDIMMPKLDGINALKEVRKRGITTPILLLTAKSEIGDKVNGLDSGADDYLTKPFVTQELLARIRAITRRAGDAACNDLTFGNLTLNRASYEISVGNQKLKLGHKEFQMLEMLMVKSGNVISTERFMEKIWGYDSDAEISIVWVYLSNLRKKFASLGANVRIKANRNIGYFLELTDD